MKKTIKIPVYVTKTGGVYTGAANQCSGDDKQAVCDDWVVDAMSDADYDSGYRKLWAEVEIDVSAIFAEPGVVAKLVPETEANTETGRK